MKYLILFLLFFTLSCSLNKVKNNHGVISLKDKFNKINVSQSNTNDIINILGPPSTKSTFDNNVWIYIERKKTNSTIFKLGNQKTEKNNVVVLEINNKAGLDFKEIQSFGLSYAKTLNLWNTQFQNSWSDLVKLGFNNRFKRMWEFYLAYCETGFISQSTDVSHFLITK